jgi:DNA-3-methyladenine glycosylase II
MTRLATALTHFKRVDPHFYTATQAHHASLPKQLSGKHTRAQLFESLVSIVISQQLGLAAADAIFSRVKKVCGSRLTPESVLKARPASLRKAGLSGAKIKTLKSIATAVKNNSLDLLSLKKVSEAEAAEKLIQIWGLGPWSVEMFLMFSLGRGDVFSPGDLGLIRAMEAIYNLPKNAPRPSLLAIAEKWSPHRTYASLLLWRTRDTKAG